MLGYPWEKLADIERYKDIFKLENTENYEKFSEFCDWYSGQDLVSLQENYVGTFDHNKRICLNLFEYIYGNEGKRGPAMAELIEEYQKAGFMLMNEMPDHLPVLLEFVYAAETNSAAGIIARLMPALQELNSNLEEADSKYAILTAIAASLLEAEAREYVGGA